MIIKNVKVYGEGFRFHPGDVVIENGVFSETASNTGEVIDGEGATRFPASLTFISMDVWVPTSVTMIRKQSAPSPNTRPLSESQQYTPPPP